MPHTPFQDRHFDPSLPFVVRKELKVEGRTLAVGDPFPHQKWKVSTRRLAQLFDLRMIGHPSEESTEATDDENQDSTGEKEDFILPEDEADNLENTADLQALDQSLDVLFKTKPGKGQKA